MSKFAGKTAIISGGAEGIGFAIAEALGGQGMNIVLADIDTDGLARAVTTLNERDVPVIGAELDVGDASAWQAVAEQASREFASIHMVVNNAGVTGDAGPIEQQSSEGWMWGLNVNLMGVVYGVQTVVPYIKEQGQGGWILNVASMAGMGGVRYGGVYAASKTAVVALSEGWFQEFKADGIAVSVLCPGFVQTRIFDSDRNRQARFQSDAAPSASAAKHRAEGAAMVKNGIDPAVVGRRVIEALNSGELYVFTHPGYRDAVRERAMRIDEAFARAEQSPVLADLVNQSHDML